MSVNICNMNKKIGFIGAGKMASAIIGGIVKSGFASPNHIFAYDISNQAIENAKLKFEINTVSSISQLVDLVDIIVIATKPFVINAVLSELEGKTTGKLVVSILAGVTTKKIETSLLNTRVVRVMPNTPALLSSGMSAICKNKCASEEDINLVKEIFSKVGKVIICEEKDINAITGVSGSGPAFYYYIIDNIAKAGEKLGLDYTTSLLLSAQTALGAAKMIMETNTTPEELIAAVTTPGGTTAEGNKVLTESNISDILYETVKKTAEKSEQMSSIK